ncbi:MAG TPA: hypothetical protein DCZ91_04870 [Lachnospiraceae bacterium]|nr:hypothetical protein [Lachnospiraceae bacterium]
MELPKNITQIGETNPHCKVYVEDYVISYIKQLNQYADEKEMAVALYGVRKEEAGITYLFFYGACRLVFLQKECRHLSQAVLQEAEKQRKKFFPDMVFLGYRLLDGEMIEGFHICEQGVCRYVEGYAQFYEKNDAMLAFMLEERQEAAQPETVDQEKYNVVKRRQEERRALAQEKSGHAMLSRRKNSRTLESAHEAAGANAGAARTGTGVNAGAGVRTKAGVFSGAGAGTNADGKAGGNGKLRGMKLTAAAVFALLCVTGLAAMGNGEKLNEWQTALRQLMENMSEQQLPDAVQVSNGTAQVGTIVAEDKLNNAILNENAAADPSLTASGAGQAQPSVQEGAQGQTQPGGQEGSQGQTQPGGPEGSQGQTQPGGQEGSQGQTQPGGQEGSQGQTQPGGQEEVQGQTQPGGQEGSQGQTQPGGQEGDQAQNQTAGQQTAQGDDGGASQESGQQAPGTDQAASSGGSEQPDQGEAQTPETKPAAGPTAELEAYTIQRGDTLIGICVRRYGSDMRVSEICSLNNIENPDDIKVGEKIFLPQ